MVTSNCYGHRVLCLVFIGLFLLTGPYGGDMAHAAAPAGYSEYYIPADEDNLSLIMDDIGYTDESGNTHSVISITAWSDDTQIYYDHWEDGYDFDDQNPNTADETSTLATKGSFVNLETASISLPRPSVDASSPCVDPDVTPTGSERHCDYDGRDRIFVAGGAVTVTRAGWVDNVGTVLSIAWEVYPVRPQLTTYIVPFGEDLWNGGSPPDLDDFERVYVLIQATEDNTTVTVDVAGDGTADELDLNRDGTPDGVFSTTLNQGEVFLVDRVSANADPLPTGAVIEADRTLQVHYVIGDEGSSYEIRGLSAFPRGFWDDEYYAPVDGSGVSGDPTDIYLHNPHDSSITVDWETNASSGSFSISAKSSVSYFQETGAYVPVDSAVYFKGSDVFWGISTIDPEASTHDWGYSLVPAFLLEQEHFMGWAPGSDPVGNDFNASGIFIAPAQDNIRVFVDFDADGTVDSTTDLDRLDTVYVFDTVDGDLSGANIYATGPYTVAYGQNPATASGGSPAIDVGYTTIPGGAFIEKVLTVDKTVDPALLDTTAGDQTTFTLTIDTYDFSMNDISAVDTLPSGWSYVPSSTVITLASGSPPAGSTEPTVTGGGLILTWPSSLLGSMGANQTITISFDAQNDVGRTQGEISRNAADVSGTRTVGGVTQDFNTSDFTFVSYGDLDVSKDSSATGPLYPGDTLTYTVTVTNPAGSGQTINNLSIYDPLPEGVSYVSNSAIVKTLPFRVTEYYLGSGEFTGTSYDLTLDQDLSSDYFVIVQGSDGAGSGSGNRGPGENYAALTADPFGTGELAASSGTDVITLERGNSVNDWIGVVTVVESLGDATGSGFNLLDVRRVVHTGATTGPSSVTSGTAWSDINQVLLMGGFNGAGCTTAETINTNQKVCHARIYPSGSDQINWTRNDVGADPTLSEATSTVMVVEWGSDWTVQRVNVTGSNGGDGANAVGEYNTGALSSTINRDNTWVWGTGHTNDQGIGDAAEGVLITLGDGVNQNTTENTVAIGMEYAGNAMDFEVYALTHPALNVDYRFKADADSGNLTVDVTVDTVSGHRMALVTNGQNGTGNAYPRPLFSARYLNDSTVRLERRRTGQNFPAWIQGIQFTDETTAGDPPNFITTGDNYDLSEGETLVLTFDVTVDDPLATGITELENTASVTSDEFPVPASDTVTDTVINPTSSSAQVSGRVWFDTDRDAVEDVGETGLSNVEVTLKDSLGTPLATTTTDGSGNYVFTGVTPGTGYYVEVTDGLPSGLEQTTPTYVVEDRTDTFDAAAGDEIMATSLGYAPPTGQGTATIGDFVWSDADGDGQQDAGEPGISGVTVALYEDTNGNGTFEIGTDTFSTSTTTAADGSYLFAGVTAGSDIDNTVDYFVYVDPGQAALSGYSRTTSSDNPFVETVEDDVLLTYDFGYQNTGTTYSITDRVWLDVNEDGEDDGESGISGVTVDLLDASDNVIASTVTGADGTFTFSGLPGNSADYEIRITDTGSVLSDFFGTTTEAVAGSVDVLNLTGDVDFTAEPTEPNFGYNVAGAIGGNLFNDNITADGAQESGEPGLSGYTVELYADTDGDGILDLGEASAGAIATLVTDAAGGYLFSGLDGGDYIVSVPSPPTNFDYTTETPGSPNSDDDPAAGHQQAVTIANGATDLTNDFGYKAQTPRSVSGTVWNDDDWQRDIDAGETGLANVTIALYLDDGDDTLETDGSDTLTSTTLTASDGTYSFDGLTPGKYWILITDDTNELDGWDPTYEKDVPFVEQTTEPFSLLPHDNAYLADLTSSDETDVDFGFKLVLATFVRMAGFSAYGDAGGIVTVEWQTAAEIGTVGFNLYRQDPVTGTWIRLNERLLPALIRSPQGGTYRFRDVGVQVGDTVVYRLGERTVKGKQLFYGPFTVTVSGATTAVSNWNPKTDQYQKIAREPERKLLPAVSMRSAMSFSAFSATPMSETGDRIRVSVVEDGFVFVDADEISTRLGLSAADTIDRIQQGGIAVSNGGNPVAYIPAQGGSGLFFYGQGIDSPYTNENVYWLDLNDGIRMVSDDGFAGDVNGDRWVDLADVIVTLQVVAGIASPELVEAYPLSGVDINDNGRPDLVESIYALQRVAELRTSSGSGSSTMSVDGTYPHTQHVETDLFAVTAVFTDPDADFWMWAYIFGDEPGEDRASFSVSADQVGTDPATASMTVHLKGGSDDADGADHHAMVYVNDTLVGEGDWNGTDAHALTVEFDQSLLAEGANTVEVRGTLNPGVGYSVFYVDSLDLTYQRFLTAKNDALEIPGAATEVTISGFTGSNVRVFDIRDPRFPIVMSETVITETGGNYSVKFPTDGSDARYLAVMLDSVAGPFAIEAADDTGLDAEVAPADYIAIVPNQGYADALQSLIAHRQAQGLTTQVVTLEQLVDTFNHGISSPEAIRNYLYHAYQERDLPPRYVLLVGNGTEDYLDVGGYGDNLMPPLMAGTEDGLFVSDNRLADVSGDDGVPEMAIGRLPVISTAQLGQVISKIISYENATGSGWETRVMMVADNADSVGDFPTDSDTVAGFVSGGYTTDKIYLNGNVGDTRTQLLAGINAGALVFNYMGHAGYFHLADEELLTEADVSALTNGEKLPIMSALTCLAGSFSFSGLDTIGEQMLLRSTGGAIAVWSPSGLSDHTNAKYLNQAFFDALFNQGKDVLGDAVRSGLAAYHNNGRAQYLPSIYNLLGDPATQLK